jgi:glycosyltransferase involved in cell wall biosynthesis
MKVVICWSNYSGYAAACWRQLQALDGVEVFVLAYAQPEASPFGPELLDGIPHRLLSPAERADGASMTRLIVAQKPDILKTTGWFMPGVRAAFLAPELAHVRKCALVDTPWRHYGQYVTRFRYRRYLDRLDAVGVPGERAWQYVQRLGFPHDRIRRHMYGVDEFLADRIHSQRAASGSVKRGFLFVGRYADEKGIDVLVEAYRRYRAMSADPWDLVCCGRGPRADLLKGQPGVIDRGFVQPADMPRQFETAGAYIMCSRFDPWPLALTEAALAGLPIIASEACGSAVEVVRSHYNGLMVATGDPEDTARAMLRMETAPLDDWGARSRQLAAPFTARMWAERWHALFETLLETGPTATGSPGGVA